MVARPLRLPAIAVRGVRGALLPAALPAVRLLPARERPRPVAPAAGIEGILRHGRGQVGGQPRRREPGHVAHEVASTRAPTLPLARVGPGRRRGRGLARPGAVDARPHPGEGRLRRRRAPGRVAAPDTGPRVLAALGRARRLHGADGPPRAGHPVADTPHVARPRRAAGPEGAHARRGLGHPRRRPRGGARRRARRAWPSCAVSTPPTACSRMAPWPPRCGSWGAIVDAPDDAARPGP